MNRPPTPNNIYTTKKIAHSTPLKRKKKTKPTLTLASRKAGQDPDPTQSGVQREPPKVMFHACRNPFIHSPSPPNPLHELRYRGLRDPHPSQGWGATNKKNAGCQLGDYFPKSTKCSEEK